MNARADLPALDAIRALAPKMLDTLKLGDGPKRLGLRADMDALPIQEAMGRPWASQVLGKMHACGHDGHTAMLLGAARHLTATRDFNGTLHLVFQPAEEGLGGARVMIEDGFFERFPCDAMFALHNMPGHPLTGSEDFAFFLEKCQGSYLLLGNGVGQGEGEGGCMVHNPGYDFNDRCLGTGASYWVRLESNPSTTTTITVSVAHTSTLL